MAGGIAIAVILLILFPVMFIMTGAVGAAILGWASKADAEARYEGSELIDLNR